MAAMDVGVGETCSGNTSRESTPGGAYGVVGSPPPNADGGALLPNVPADTGEEFEATAKTEEAHDDSISRGSLGCSKRTA